MPSVSLTQNSIPAGYQQFVNGHPYALMFHSPQWLDVISASAFGEMFVLHTQEDGVLTGVLPVFVSEDKGMGRVGNSLPFFGSNGAILAAPGKETEVFPLLLQAMETLAADFSLRSYTLIQSIRDEQDDLYEKHLQPTFTEERLCQMAPLPKDKEELMTALSPCKRNNVRRAWKLGVSVRPSTRSEDLMWIREMHVKRMEGIGGTAKPESFFEKAVEHVEQGYFTMHIADTEEGLPCAGLVTATHGTTMEYLFPVTDWELRNHKGLQLLIYDSMYKAIEAGLTHFNFGGTWPSQKSLYDFKARFGAVDFNYNYYTRVIDSTLLDHSPEELVSAFPFYFAVPFSKLSSQ